MVPKKLDMISKEVLKTLRNLSLDELRVVLDYINSLIAKREAFNTKKQTELNNNVPASLRQERSYEIFTCKFKKTTELESPAFSGIVVDISKGGLRLKTNKKINRGDILVIFPEKTQEGNSLSISPAYDSLHKKTFVEVIRANESMGFYEIGCKFLPLNSQLYTFIV